MKSSERILELLFDRKEGFFPLEELARSAALTPRRLENALAAIAQQGHEIETSPFGLRLRRPVRLDGFLVERNLGTRRVGRHVLCFDEVGSTNDVAFDSARQKGADGVVVLADSQQSGRGRQGRAWISPAGANLLMSALLVDERSQLAHEPLTIASGLAIAMGVEEATGARVELKWPNDLLLDGAKLAGILVEVRTVQKRRCVVIGAGVNVNAAPPAGRLGQPAVCLADYLGHPVDRLELLRAMLRRLDHWVEAVEGGDCETLHRRWVERCGMMNQRVSALCGGTPVTGRVLDVSPLEGLILLCDDGRQVYLHAANSTIVK